MFLSELLQVYLLSSGWSFGAEAKIPIAKATAWETHWDQIIKLDAAGHSVLLIAAACNVTVPVVSKVLKKASEGYQPEASRKLLLAAIPAIEVVQSGREPKYVKYAVEVARLRDTEKISFVKIRVKIREIHDVDLDLPTIARAYKYAHPEIVHEAIETGERPKHGKRVRTPLSTHNRLELCLRSDPWETDRVISRMTGCTEMAVYRKRKELGILKKDLRERITSLALTPNRSRVKRA